MGTRRKRKVTRTSSERNEKLRGKEVDLEARRRRKTIYASTSEKSMPKKGKKVRRIGKGKEHILRKGGSNGGEGSCQVNPQALEKESGVRARNVDEGKRDAHWKVRKRVTACKNSRCIFFEGPGPPRLYGHLVGRAELTQKYGLQPTCR